MKIMIKLAALGFATIGTAAYAATPATFAAACCALGICCGQPCCA